MGFLKFNKREKNLDIRYDAIKQTVFAFVVSACFIILTVLFIQNILNDETFIYICDAATIAIWVVAISLKWSKVISERTTLVIFYFVMLANMVITQEYFFNNASQSLATIEMLTDVIFIILFVVVIGITIGKRTFAILTVFPIVYLSVLMYTLPQGYLLKNYLIELIILLISVLALVYWWKSTFDAFVRNKNDLESELKIMAQTDGLLAIPNRQYMEDEIERMISSNTPNLYVGLIDIDNFKSINDNLGHGVGDDVLISCTSRIREALSDCGEIGRYGGDEFIFYAIKPADNEIRNCLDKIININKKCSTCSFTFSIGVARYKEGLTLKKLVLIADENLYEAKNKGKNRYII